MKPLLKPRALRRGDLIGLVAPAGAIWDLERTNRAVRYLEGLGYRVEVGAHAGGQHGAFAGTDDERVGDLNQFLRDPRIRGVFALRGGYGTMRLLEAVDYRAARRDPKVVVGYSDITALQLALYRRIGLVSFSGPLSAVEFATGPDPYTEEHFWRLVTSCRKPGRLRLPPGGVVISSFGGKAKGPLLGGCLSLVVALLGTRYSPSYRGSILFLEDVHEQLHRLDRMLIQLRLAGILGAASGILLGQFTDLVAADPVRPHASLASIFESVFAGSTIPRVSEFPYGHLPCKATLPIGLPAFMDADRGLLRFEEAAVLA